MSYGENDGTRIIFVDNDKINKLLLKLLCFYIDFTAFVMLGVHDMNRTVVVLEHFSFIRIGKNTRRSEVVRKRRY